MATKKSYQFGRETFTTPEQLKRIQEKYNSGGTFFVGPFECTAANDVKIPIDGGHFSASFSDFLKVIENIHQIIQEGGRFQTAESALMFREYLARFICRFVIPKYDFEKYGLKYSGDVAFSNSYEAMPPLEQVRASATANTKRDFINAFREGFEKTVSEKPDVKKDRALRSLLEKMMEDFSKESDVYIFKVGGQKEEKELPKEVEAFRQNVDGYKFLVSFLKSMANRINTIYADDAKYSVFASSTLEKVFMLLYVVHQGYLDYLSVNQSFVDRMQSIKDQEGGEWANKLLPNEPLKSSAEFVEEFIHELYGLKNPDYFIKSFHLGSRAKPAGYKLPPVDTREGVPGQQHNVASRGKRYFTYHLMSKEHLKNWWGLMQKVFFEGGYLPLNSNLHYIKEVTTSLFHIRKTGVLDYASDSEKYIPPTLDDLLGESGGSIVYQFLDFVYFCVKYNFVERVSITNGDWYQSVIHLFLLLNSFLYIRKDTLKGQPEFMIVFPLSLSKTSEEEEDVDESSVEEEEEVMGLSEKDLVKNRGVFLAPMFDVSFKSSPKITGQKERDLVMRIKQEVNDLYKLNGSFPTLIIEASSGTRKAYANVGPHTILLSSEDYGDKYSRLNAHANFHFRYNVSDDKDYLSGKIKKQSYGKYVYISCKDSKLRYWSGVNLGRLGGIPLFSHYNRPEKEKKNIIGRVNQEEVLFNNKLRKQYFSDLANFSTRLVALLALLDKNYETDVGVLKDKDVERLVEFVRTNIAKMNYRSFPVSSFEDEQNIGRVVESILNLYMKSKLMDPESADLDLSAFQKMRAPLVERLKKVFTSLQHFTKMKSVQYRSNWLDYEEIFRRELPQNAPESEKGLEQEKLQFWSFIYDDSFLYRSFFGEERKNVSSRHTAENVHWIFVGDFDIESDQKNNSVIIRPSSDKENSYIVYGDEFKAFANTTDLGTSGVEKYLNFMIYNFPVVCAHRSLKKRQFNVDNLYVYVGPINQIIPANPKSVNDFLGKMKQFLSDGFMDPDIEDKQSEEEWEKSFVENLRQISDDIQELNIREQNLANTHQDVKTHRTLTFRLERDGDENVILDRLQGIIETQRRVKNPVFSSQKPVFNFVFSIVGALPEMGDLGVDVLHQLASYLSKVDAMCKAKVVVGSASAVSVSSEVESKLEEGVLALKQPNPVFTNFSDYVYDSQNIINDIMVFVKENNILPSIVSKIYNIEEIKRAIRTQLRVEASARVYSLQVASKNYFEGGVKFYIENIEYNEEAIHAFVYYYLLYNLYSALS